jgi:hypothetical protein
VLALFAVWSVAARAGEVDLGCPEVGDVVRYNLTTTRTRTKAPGADPVSLGSTTSTHRFEVLAVDGAILRVADRAESGTLLQAPPDPLMAELMGELAGLKAPPVVLVIDTAARTMAVPDLTPLITARQQLLNRLVAKWGDSRPELIERARVLLLDPTAVSTSVTQSIVPLARFTCGTVPNSAKYSSWIPNLWGGPQISALGTQKAQTKGAVVTLTATESGWPEALKPVAVELAGRLGLPSVEELPPAEAVAQVQLALRSELVVTLTRGEPWPEGWQATKTMSSVGPSQVETLRVERQPVD